jgi:hypothetical protein
VPLTRTAHLTAADRLAALPKKNALFFVDALTLAGRRQSSLKAL